MSKETPETDVSFNLSPMKSKPKRKYRKGSKYDPIIDGVLEALKTEKLIKVTSEKEPNYLRTQLNKRIESRSLQKVIKISVTNNIVYAEKV